MIFRFINQNPFKSGPPCSYTSFGVPSVYFLKFLTNFSAKFFDTSLNSFLSDQVFIGFNILESTPLQLVGINRLNPGTFSYCAFYTFPL